MAIRFRSPLEFKKTPDQLVKELFKLDLQLKQAGIFPQAFGLTDGVLWQQLSGKLGIAIHPKIYETQTVIGQAAAYSYCPIVTSIVTKRGDNIRNGRWCIEDNDGNEIEKGDNPLFKLLKKPNPIQTWGQFLTQAYAFRDIFGVCYMLPLVPEGFGKNSIKAIYVVPNWSVTPEFTGKTFFQSELSGIVSGYKIDGGIGRLIEPEEMICWNDNCINASLNSSGLNQSRLFPLSDQISNFNAAYGGRRNLIEKGGALGMWVNDNAKDAGGRNPITPTEKEKIIQDFQETYGVERGKSPFSMTTASIRFEKAGYPTKELMLFEEIKDCAQVIAAAYNLSPFDLPWADQTTYTNKDKTDRALYQNVTIPDAESIADLLSEHFQLNGNLRVYFDHIDCLQRSKKDEADAINVFVTAASKLWNDGAITKDEYRALLFEFMPQGATFDPENPLGDEYFTGSVLQKFELTPAKI